MSQEEIISAYQRYKEDTTLFTTWLSNAAKSCGWKPTKKAYEQPQAKTTPPPPNAKSTRLKGKERKQAREAAKANTVQRPSTAPAPGVKYYNLTTKEILDQVEIISESPSNLVSMPQKVRNALRSAIGARQRFCNWFDRIELGTQESREGHHFFLDMLKSALNVLSGKQDLGGSEKATASSSTVEKDSIFMRNAFQALEVEDITDDELLSISDVSPPPTASSAKRETYLYQLEMDRQAEVAFIVFSFFEDLHRMRNELGLLWNRFRDGEIDFLHATCLTSAAMELMRRSEEEAYKAYTTVFEPTENTYAGFLDVVYIANALTFGQPPGAPELSTFTMTYMTMDRETGVVSSAPQPKARGMKQSDLEISPLDEFVYLPAGRTLTKIARGRLMMQGVNWPAPIPGMQANYIIKPEMLDDPRMKGFLRQDKFICQLILDMNLEDQMRSNVHIPQELKDEHMTRWTDPLFATLRPLWDDGHVSVGMVWAAQVAFDIHEICSGDAMGTYALEAASEKIDDSFQFFVNEARSLDTRDVRWKTPDAHHLLHIYRFADSGTSSPLLSLMKSNLLENHEERPDAFPMSGNKIPPQVMEHLNNKLRAAGSPGWANGDQKFEEGLKKIGPTMVEPNEDPSFLVDANLLYPGTMLLDITSRIEEAGTSLANHHQTIFGMAHLYNALTQLGLLDTRWPEMERVIELHAGPIFANDIPKKPKDMVSKFAYRTGITTPNAKRYNTRKPWRLETTAATQSLRKFFASSTRSSPSILSIFGAQAEMHELRSSSSTRPAKRRQIQVTPRQTLIRLGKYLDDVFPDMQIDYVSLTRQCSGLLKKMRRGFAEEVGMEYPVLREGNDSNDLGLLVIVFAVLYELEIAVAKVKSARSGGRLDEEESDEVLESAPHTTVAKELLEAFLMDEEDSDDEL